MNIRSAVMADLSALLEMGKRFFEASGYADIARYDAQSFATTLIKAMESEDSVILVAKKDKPVGMAGALVYPFYFDFNHRTAQELFWWVDPEHRGIGSQLFDAMIEAVRMKGAQSLSMIALEALEPEKVGAFYMKRGFRPSERSYIRSL